ncbi:MAG TPA: ABC transporter ATP-binding protein [Solirubrobacterales bacterium]|jgi:ABC-type polysaccharide/polyol phosphate transport system ATPase subunit|nr:ABC transporter ATP-binding protein [Solirubrobacterales bacterium]
MSVDESAALAPTQVAGDKAVWELSKSPVAISVRDVSKRFMIPQERVHTLKQRIIHPRKRKFDPLDALKNVDFDIHEGEFFGIVGRNGSGKSTLLKCIAGIYTPQHGEIAVRGKLSTFIELGVGFNPELSARDNVVLNATLLGLSTAEANEKFDDIIAFAELEDFVDLKLKNFSSGMHVRLAFSVAVHVESSVLLIDEVLAVGDAAFQQKCFDTFDRFLEEGRTVVFVTHDMALVERFCTRALMLDRGDIACFGHPSKVAHEYMRVNFDHTSLEDEDREVGRIGDGAAEIVDCWFEDRNGVRASRLRQGEPAGFKSLIRFNEPMRQPILGVVIKDHKRRPIFMTNTVLDGVKAGQFETGDEVTYEVTFDNLFEDGHYLASPVVVHDGGVNVADLREEMIALLVTGRQNAGGRVNFPHESKVLR